jgi:hypothetical protein
LLSFQHVKKSSCIVLTRHIIFRSNKASDLFIFQSFKENKLNKIHWIQFQSTLWHFLCGSEQLRRYSDSLRDGRSGDRIPVEARFFAPVQTGPGAHPASYTMGTSLYRGNAVGVWRWPPTSSSIEVKERVELYLCSLSGPSWPVLGWTLPLRYFTLHLHFLDTSEFFKKSCESSYLCQSVY